MSVEISVNWNFQKGGDEAHVSYRAGHVDPQRPNGREQRMAAPVATRVIPLGSSVLAPGLSKPIPAR